MKNSLGIFAVLVLTIGCGASQESHTLGENSSDSEITLRHVAADEMERDLEDKVPFESGTELNEEADLRATWKQANLTYFNSYPAPGSAECLEYNGCQWAGMFAALSNKKSLDWVKSHNIIAVHSKHFNKYRLKTFRIRSGSLSIDAKVYDMCSDSDCNGCCTNNSRGTGFLIDMEKFTKQRFGKGSGTVEWRCLDC